MNRLYCFPKEITWRDYALGGALAAVYVAWLALSARTLGFARDEGFYFRAAENYAGWFELLFRNPAQALQQSSVDHVWGENHEHPSLMKSLFAFSWMFFFKKWHLFSDASTAFRFPGMVMGGLSLFLVYLFGARGFSRGAGFFGAILLGLMPRIFYHAHLACFDVGIMTMWLLSVYVYWRATVEKGWWWPVLFGITYGLTLDTKHNAWILPAVFAVHTLFVQGQDLGRDLRAGKLSLPTNLVAMVTIGPLVFYALWPWLWNDTLPRLQEYVNFHVNHVYYNMEFLGRNYFEAPSPRMYMPVMVVATVPTITLLLFATGAIHRLRDELPRLKAAFKKNSDAPPVGDPAQMNLLLLLALAAPLAVFLLPKTPIFGGTKHWFPAYPFLALFAGHGATLVERALREKLRRWWPPASTPTPLPDAALPRAGSWILTGVAIATAPLFETAHSHPVGLSAYVPIVGGTAGGADLGLNRQFWGFTTENVAPWLEKNAPRGASIFIHDTAWDSWERMRDEHRVRRDLQATSSPGAAQFSLVQHELHMNEVDHSIWIAYGKTAPTFVYTHDGVPIVSVYARR